MAQALQQLRANKLRSFLSLLGISIGIFCIIGVLSAVSSLEDNVRGSLSKIGEDVIYVTKWPWADASGEWWKFIKRPNPTHEDYEVIRERAQLASLTAYQAVIGVRTIKYRSNSVDGAFLITVTQDYDRMYSMEFDRGRYFSPVEYQYGSNKLIIGYEVAQTLFGTIDPVGRIVKMQGRNYEVIGVVQKAGDDLINPVDFDNVVLVSYPNGRGLANLKSTQIFDTSVSIKKKPGVEMRDLQDELRGILRAHRRIKPIQEDNFALNELSLIATFLDGFFGVLNLLGIIIGAFALLVGGFSVANIMFVSVKERTNIIGIKKALGAKRYIILLEFLIEAIILCLIGGLIGLLLVVLVTTILSNVINFELYLDFQNAAIGIICSILIGVISGVVPAMQGASLDPVEAMRK